MSFFSGLYSLAIQLCSAFLEDISFSLSGNSALMLKNSLHFIFSTVPLENMGPFAAILRRSNRGFGLQYHLGKTTSNHIKTSVSPRLFPDDLHRSERQDAVGFE